MTMVHTPAHWVVRVTTPETGGVEEYRMDERETVLSSIQMTWGRDMSRIRVFTTPHYIRVWEDRTNRELLAADRVTVLSIRSRPEHF